jgi:hypothetical protein
MLAECHSFDKASLLRKKQVDAVRTIETSHHQVSHQAMSNRRTINRTDVSTQALGLHQVSQKTSNTLCHNKLSLHHLYRRLMVYLPLSHHHETDRFLCQMCACAWKALVPTSLPRVAPPARTSHVILCFFWMQQEPISTVHDAS